MTFQEILAEYTASDLSWLSSRAGYAVAVEQQYQNFVLKTRQAADLLRDVIREPGYYEQATDPVLAQRFATVIFGRIVELDHIADQEDNAAL